MSFREVSIYDEVIDSLCIVNALDMNEMFIVNKYKSLYHEFTKHRSSSSNSDKLQELVLEMDKLINTEPIQKMLLKKRQEKAEILRKEYGEYGKDWI